MLDQKTAVGLATKLVEAGVDVEISVRHTPEPEHADEPSPTSWTVTPKAPMNLDVVTEIASSFGLVAWIGFGGQGTVNFKKGGN